MKEIYLLLDDKRYFKQQIRDIDSLDVNRMVYYFNQYGYQIKIVTFEEIVNKKLNFKDQVFIYTSSQNEQYKNYLDDLLFYLSKTNRLLPAYDLFKCHENKGYQELLKKEKEIKSLVCLYFGNLNGLEEYMKHHTIKFPIIFKTVNGAMSTGVMKVNNYKDLRKVVKKKSRRWNLLFQCIKLRVLEIIRRVFFFNQFNKVDSTKWCKDKLSNFQFILQEYVPNLRNDWKIIIFNNKYFGLYRGIKKNDFRASGSGKWEYRNIPEEVLDFARNVFLKLDAPFASLDIVFDGETCHLIEFQIVHFGPVTYLNSKEHYEYKNGQWMKCPFYERDLEKEYVTSYIGYLEKGSYL